MEDGIYARIPIGELSIEEAYDQVEDPSFWDDTMPAIMFHFSVGDYWKLRVVEHRRLYDFLIERGAITDGDST